MKDHEWQNHLKNLSGGYKLKGDCIPLFNHLERTLKFMESLNIDSEDKNLLDVGCNNDFLRKYIKSKWHGIDLCDKFESECEEYIEGDMHSLPYSDKLYDIVFCSHALEHSISPIIVLSEIRRVLKDDGDMIISIPIYPDFVDPTHNYLMPCGSWEHIFNILKMEVVKKQYKDGTAEYHLRKKCKN